jgi:hypothetical protein
MSTVILTPTITQHVKYLREFFTRNSFQNSDSRLDQVVISEGLACVSNGVMIAAKVLGDPIKGVTLPLPFEAVDELPDGEVAIHQTSFDIAFSKGRNLQQFRTRTVLISPSLLRDIGLYSVTFDREDLITQLRDVKDAVIGSSFFTDKIGRTVAHVKQPTVSFDPQLLIPGLEEIKEDFITLHYSNHHSPISVSDPEWIYMLMPLNRKPDETGQSQDRLEFSIREVEEAKP